MEHEREGIEAIISGIRPRRRIDGIAALLLPFDPDGRIDSDGYRRLLRLTVESGLRPAVNMDTGYVHLLTADQRRAVLETARETLSGRPFVAGAFVEGDDETVLAYLREVEQIQSFGGTPILFQCSLLKSLGAEALVNLYREVASQCDAVLAFELGDMFAPFGQIYHLEVVEALMEIPTLVGLKHSSLDRGLEWQRLQLRDRVRPDFRIYTGNDLAIDMVIYGSDYLLGLAGFAPDLFALRDRYWERGDPRFYQLNDHLQYLGAFSFRPPVPAYRHSAAQFLRLRGLVGHDSPHPESPRRPASDREILGKIWKDLARADSTAAGG